MGAPPAVKLRAMTQRLFLLALALGLALPTGAQTAPALWQTQTRDGGARTLVPPDLQTGEVYSITVYPDAPVNGKSLEAWLRGFAGVVGEKPGQLAAPLQIEARENRVVSGTGIYVGPNGSRLGALFIGATGDGGQTVRVARTLFSSETVLEHYQNQNAALVKEMTSALVAASQPKRPLGDEPQEVADIIRVGGPLKAGVYVGMHREKGLFGAGSQRPLRVYLYANGEYRITDRHDEDFDFSGPLVGKYKYNAARGLLDLSAIFDLKNSNISPDRDFCYYGVDKDGTPTILARGGISPKSTTYLFWQGPPTKRLSPSAQNAPALARQRALDAIQTVVPPGQGVASAQIAALVHDFSDTVITLPGAYVGETFGGFSSSITSRQITDEVYLLLRDGTVYRGLQIAPDQFDVAASKRKEPENWGLWKTENGQTQVSLGGQPYQKLDGHKVLPVANGTRWSGRYLDSSLQGAISFTAAGRFARNAPAKSEVVLIKAQTQVAGGDLKGTYALDGYALTLRYDNGKVTRTPFFFGDPKRETLWLEGHRMVWDK